MCKQIKKARQSSQNPINGLQQRHLPAAAGQPVGGGECEKPAFIKLMEGLQPSKNVPSSRKNKKYKSTDSLHKSIENISKFKIQLSEIKDSKLDMKMNSDSLFQNC